MNKAEVVTGVAVVFVAGAIVYSAKLGLTTLNLFGRKTSKISANQQIAAAAIQGSGGDPSSFIQGASIYLANTPWPFGPNVGNTIPPTSGGVNIPGAGEGDFLGFNTN